jgi:hypothetical protein
MTGRWRGCSRMPKVPCTTEVRQRIDIGHATDIVHSDFFHGETAHHTGCPLLA